MQRDNSSPNIVRQCASRFAWTTKRGTRDPRVRRATNNEQRSRSRWMERKEERNVQGVSRCNSKTLLVYSMGTIERRILHKHRSFKTLLKSYNKRRKYEEDRLAIATRHINLESTKQLLICTSFQNVRVTSIGMKVTSIKRLNLSSQQACFNSPRVLIMFWYILFSFNYPFIRMYKFNVRWIKLNVIESFFFLFPIFITTF